MSKIPPYVQDVLTLLQGNDRESKIMAIKASAILKHTCFIPVLINNLDVIDEQMSIEIINALASIANLEAVNCLLDFVVSENKSISKAIIDSLNRIKPQILLEPLLKFITKKNISNSAIYKEILKLLVPINDTRVSVLFTELLNKSKEPILIIEALKHFIIFPSNEKISLIRMQTGHSSWEVSTAAYVALSRLNDLSAFSHIKKTVKSNVTQAKIFVIDLLNLNPLPSDKELFETLLSDSDFIIRDKAIEGLKIFTSEERIRLLKSRLRQETDNSIYLKLLQLASKEYNYSFFSEFIKIFDNTSAQEQEIAKQAIINMGEKIIPYLLDEIKKSSLVLKEKIIGILSKISVKDSQLISNIYNSIISFLDSNERWLKINSIEALSNLALNNSDRENLVQKFIQMLKSDTDSWIKATILIALGKIGSSSEAEIIFNYLNSTDPRVRANAVEAMGRIGIADKLEKIKSMLSDPNDRVRANAAIILYKNGYSDVILALKDMLNNGTKWIKASAAYACGEICCKELVDDLIKLLNDKEDVVYKNAIEALAKIGDVRALLPILREQSKNRLPLQKINEILSKYSQNLHKNLNFT